MFAYYLFYSFKSLVSYVQLVYFVNKLIFKLMLPTIQSCLQPLIRKNEQLMNL